MSVTVLLPKGPAVGYSFGDGQQKRFKRFDQFVIQPLLQLGAPLTVGKEVQSPCGFPQRSRIRSTSSSVISSPVRSQSLVGSGRFVRNDGLGILDGCRRSPRRQYPGQPGTVAAGDTLDDRFIEGLEMAAPQFFLHQLFCFGFELDRYILSLQAQCRAREGMRASEDSWFGRCSKRALGMTL